MRVNARPITRRRFISALGVGAAAVIAAPDVMAATVSTRSPVGDIWMSPLLPETGTFGRTAILARASNAILRAGGTCPGRWDEMKYWEQIGVSLRSIERSAVSSVLTAYFDGFVHSADHAEFGLQLALAGRQAGSAPTTAEVVRLSEYLFGNSEATHVFVPFGVPHVDVQRFDLMLDVEEFKSRPQTGPEYDGAMVAAASGMHYAAFLTALRMLTPVVRNLRAEVVNDPAANVGDALCELLLGGIQVIAYQDDLGRKPDGVLLMAQLMRRGYLVVGRDSHGALAIAKIDWSGLEPTE
jgi:hypothetical protein